MSDILVINAVDLGMSPSNSAAANTTALQTAIDTAATSGRAVYIPAGRYQFTAITANAGTTLYGDTPDVRVQDPFGSANWLLPNVTQGTYLVSTATTGAAITVIPAAGTRKFSLSRIGLIGPGTGTSTGLRVDQSQRGRISDVLIANFYVGYHNTFTYFWSVYDLQVWGCVTGIHMHGCNNHVLYNTNLQLNQVNALRLENCSVANWFGGCTEVNFGTPILLDQATSMQVFDGWYFEDIPSPVWGNQPLTASFDVKAGCDYNSFRNCHWPGSGTQSGVIRGNHNQVLFPQGPIVLDLAESLGGTYIGTFVIPPSYTANTALNTIIDHNTTTGKIVLPSNIFMPPGKKVHLGPGANYDNWVARGTFGDTEINSATEVVKANQTMQAPAYGARRTNDTFDRVLLDGQDGCVRIGNGIVPPTTAIFSGPGSPENVVAAPIGSIYLRSDGGIRSTLYVKESCDDCNIGWIGK